MKRLDAILRRESNHTVSIELREETENLLIGYLTIDLVPSGARVEGTDGRDEMVRPELIILHKEEPS